MKLKVLIHPAEEGGYWAELPALRGCATQGETKEETINNIKEAFELIIETMEEDGMKQKSEDPYEEIIIDF